MDLDDGKSGTNDSKGPRVTDLCQVYKFPEKKFITVRLMPGLRAAGGYWVAIKKRDGSKTAFNTPCRSFDPESQTRDSTIPDAWRDVETAFREVNPDAGKDGKPQPPVRFAKEWYMEGIVRMEQRRMPETMPKATAAERTSGLKDLDSDTPTPVFAIKIGASLLGKLQALKELNVVEGKSGTKAFAVNDARWGVDVKILYDSKKAPADQYMVQTSEKHTPLTEEELAYLKPKLDESLTVIESDPKAVASEVADWAKRMGLTQYLPKKGKKAAAEDEEDDEDDEPVTKGKKPAAKKKAAPVEDDDFDDEEDDEPAPKKKAAPVAAKKPAAKKKAAPVEDDDLEDDDIPF